MQPSSPQFIIRISNNSIAFAVQDSSGEVTYTPYECRSGVSIAANLREAFRDTNILQHAGTKVIVLIDSPTLVIPLEEYQADEVAEQFHYTFPAHERDAIEWSVLPSLKNVVAFAVPKDLKTVLGDNFENMRLQPLMLPVWEFLLQRSYGGTNKKLYAYFHDGRMEVCSFTRNRFMFCNSFEINDMHDAVYFLLGVWKQIAANATTDDLFLAGHIVQREQLIAEVKKFLRRVYHINPSADLNRAPVTQVLGLPLDVMLNFI